MTTYTNLGIMGSGAQSIVYKAINNQTLTLCALKETRSKTCAMKELAALRKLSHTNVIKLRGLIWSDDIYFLEYEFLDMDLESFVNRLPYEEALPVPMIQTISYQIAMGLHHCHMNGVVHRDLKPTNILVNIVNGLVKIADFGISTIGNVNHPLYAGTLPFMAPEILLGHPNNSYPVDIWAMGCTMYFLFTKNLLFSGDTCEEVLNEIYQGIGPLQFDNGTGGIVNQTFLVSRTIGGYNCSYILQFPKDLTFYGSDLVLRALIKNPATRLSICEIMEHPFFDCVLLPTTVCVNNPMHWTHAANNGFHF